MINYLIPSQYSREINQAFNQIMDLRDQYDLIELLASFSLAQQDFDLQHNSPIRAQIQRISTENKDFFTLLAFHVLDEIRNAEDLLRASIYQKLHRILELNPFGEIESPETHSGISRTLLAYAINIGDPEAVKILTIYQENIFHPSVKNELKNLLASTSNTISLNSRKTLEIFNILINSGLGLDRQDLLLINYRFNEFISKNFRQLQLLSNKEIIIYQQEMPELIESVRNLLTINRQILDIDSDPNQLNILRINELEIPVNHLGLKNILSKIKTSQANSPKNSGCASCFTRVLRAKESFNNYLLRTNPELFQELNEFITRNDSSFAKSNKINFIIANIIFPLPERPGIQTQNRLASGFNHRDSRSLNQAR